MQHERKFLFELLVPAEEAQLQAVDGDTDRYDAELRPELMRRTIAAIQDAKIEVDIWKIEGVDERSDCEMLVAQARTGGRDGVVCVVLGRGADDAKVDQWLQAAAPVDGFVGFAIGRSIWWEPLEGLRRRQDRPRRRRAQDRRELPALRRRLRARQDDLVKMRQSLGELERAFAKEISLERRRRDSLQRRPRSARCSAKSTGVTSAARCASSCSCSR